MCYSVVIVCNVGLRSTRMRKVWSACADGWALCGHNQSSPHGSVMSCQSLAARPYDDADSPCTVTFHRSVRFSSESRSHAARPNDAEAKRETPGGWVDRRRRVTEPASPDAQCDRVVGSISLTALPASAMSQSAPAATSLDAERGATCRFPKLEECAHFHYERVALGGLRIELLPEDDAPDSPVPDAADDEEWVGLRVRSHVASPEACDEARPLSASWSEGSDVREWTLARSRDNFLQLDDMLHRCIYDRRVSGLPELRAARARGADWRRLVADYVHHLSIIADDSINCGPALNWFQMDNKGHKLLVANEDSSSINTPAVAAAYSVRKYVSQARDEISFDVGDMISIIDMPGPQESLWWRGKRGFRVGFFPHNCVAVIGDKVPRHMTQPPPIVGSVAVAPIKPVLRKHGKLISLFRSFILSRPSRRSLKRQGILRERVFGCDLGEHLLNCGRDVPAVLEACAAGIERRGAVDGVYRLSGGAALTQRLRAAFDAAAPPPAADVEAALARDPHALASLLKTYFRELPNPLCTYRLYDAFVAAVQRPSEAERLRAMRDTVAKLPPPHYRTLAYLARHLRRVSLLAESTGMTARNMAIVWAPNLLRSPHPQHALQGVAVQAVVTEFLICYAEELFAGEQADVSGPDSLDTDESEVQVELRGAEPGRRPKSLPVNPPTKLLSLEEARRRGRAGGGGAAPSAPPAPAPCGTIAAAARTQLRPASHLRPKYIEVGSGPNNLPQYHTVLDLPIPGTKRALKRSPSGWRGLFSRSKQQRARAAAPPPVAAPAPPAAAAVAAAVAAPPRAKSCESLTSEPDALAPLSPARGERGERAARAHARSASCDSYFEPWQAELAGMRLRLSPQERDRHMFSEEDDAPPPQESWCSSPASGVSAEPSPRRPPPDLAERKRVALERLERQVAQLGYIDHEPEPAQPAPGKRLCTDRDSPQAPAPAPAAAAAAVGVKLRERNSPRKQKNGGRYSALPGGGEAESPARLTWHGRDHHATRIAVHWPESTSPAASPVAMPPASPAATPTATSPASPAASPAATPVTPRYDPLDSDSEASGHTRTITVGGCRACDRGQCLECELRAADPPRLSRDCSAGNLDSASADVSYRRLNRLSAVSGSSASDRRDTAATSRPTSSTYSDGSLKPDDSPAYLDLSAATSPGSPSAPRLPLTSTVSITFRSPSRAENYEPLDDAETPTNGRDSAAGDAASECSLAIAEGAPVPADEASLPAQRARHPPADLDVYSQVKFFKRSIEEVNAMILATPDAEGAYENVEFDRPEPRAPTPSDDGPCDHRDYENVLVGGRPAAGGDNGNGNGDLAPASVRELAGRFESPADAREPLQLEGADRARGPDAAPTSPDTSALMEGGTARSLDESAFVREFGSDARETRRRPRLPPDLNLNTEEPEPPGDAASVTPATENKICLVQRFDARKPDLRDLIGFDAERKLSRERIEKYKEERRSFLREKYGSQSFRGGPEHLMRLKLRREGGGDGEDGAGGGEPPAFERRNTVDLGQRARLSLARSATDLAPPRKEKVSPSYNIRDMAAMFEQRSQSNSNG